MTPVKKHFGRPKITWLGSVINDVEENSDILLVKDATVNLETFEVIHSGRKVWNETLGRMMLNKLICSEENVESVKKKKKCNFLCFSKRTKSNTVEKCYF